MTRWLAWVLYEWVLIAAALTVAYLGPWWLLPVCVLVIGRGQNALSILGHEQIHRAIDGTSRHDRLADLLCFWPIGVSVAGFRPFHLKHHAFLLSAQDPEVQQRAMFPDRWEGLTRKRKAALIASDLTGLTIAEPIAVARATSGRWTLARSAYCVGLASLAAYALGWAALVWPITLFTVAWACMRARMWGEHLGPEKTQRYVAAWWERALYLPYGIWKHYDHHTAGRWSVPAWELRP